MYRDVYYISSHRMHAEHRYGLCRACIDVAWFVCRSVCLSVYVLVTCHAKWLNRSRCRLRGRGGLQWANRTSVFRRGTCARHLGYTIERAVQRRSGLSLCMHVVRLTCDQVVELFHPLVVVWSYHGLRIGPMQ